MERKVNGLSLLPATLVIFSFLFLSGCVASKNETAKDAMAVTSEKQMTGTELKLLLESGITLKLGGEGERYEGDLVLLSDGTGKGQYVTNKGKKGRIEGTWEIVGDEFCRVWKEVTNGEKVCERWIVIGENKVEVRKINKKSGKYKKTGINSW